MLDFFLFPFRTAFRGLTTTAAAAITQSRAFGTQRPHSPYKKMGKKAKIHIDESTFDLPPHPAFSTQPNGALSLDDA